VCKRSDRLTRKVFEIFDFEIKIHIQGEIEMHHNMLSVVSSISE
jgi:hypothetical protein